VRWAFAFVKDEIDFKVQLVFANDNAKNKPEDAMAARLLNLIDADTGASTSVLANRIKIDKASVEAIMQNLVERGDVICRDSGRKYKGQAVMMWYRAN
jgi:transcription initiation factor IIE alpha subunit